MRVWSIKPARRQGAITITITLHYMKITWRNTWMNRQQGQTEGCRFVGVTTLAPELRFYLLTGKGSCEDTPVPSPPPLWKDGRGVVMRPAE